MGCGVSSEMLNVLGSVDHEQPCSLWIQTAIAEISEEGLGDAAVFCVAFPKADSPSVSVLRPCAQLCSDQRLISELGSALLPPDGR